MCVSPWKWGESFTDESIDGPLRFLRRWSRVPLQLLGLHQYWCSWSRIYKLFLRNQRQRYRPEEQRRGYHQGETKSQHNWRIFSKQTMKRCDKIFWPDRLKTLNWVCTMAWTPCSSRSSSSRNPNLPCWRNHSKYSTPTER